MRTPTFSAAPFSAAPFSAALALLLGMLTSLAPADDVAAAFRPVRPKSHVEKIQTGKGGYTIDVGGTVDMDNTTTRRYETFAIAFQNNLSLTIANTGSCTVKHPRVITNGKRRWWSMEQLLGEILEGAEDDQQKALLIWEFVRNHRHHDDPIFSGDELHDPVKMLNVFGAGLCDDSGYVGCSLLYHAGLNREKYGRNPSERTLHGHMMCEAMLPGGYQFLDIDENTFYLDLENDRPVAGDAIAGDHYLAKREHAYGPIFKGWQIGEGAASLFGRDDGSTFRAVAGHRIEFDLRPGEQIVYRWDNCGKFASDDGRGKQNRRFWGNSLWVYEPLLTPQRIEADAHQVADEFVIYEMKTPYAACGGRVQAVFRGVEETDRFAVSISTDAKQWSRVWTHSGKGRAECDVETDAALKVKQAPAKYAYFVKVTSGRDVLRSLRIETELMTSPHALPRLSVGRNRVEYSDETAGPHEVTITHRWRESDHVTPPKPPTQPTTPANGQTVGVTTVLLKWPADDEAQRYHIRVSRNEDMRLPYRPCFDVIIESSQHHAPFAGLFSPGQEYYWRVRPCNRHGVWGSWSPVWRFRWRGPRIPVHLEHHVQQGRIAISWKPNPHGEPPARYEVYGSDERGFTPSKTPYEVEGLGTQPSNLLCTTSETKLPVVAPDATAAAMNRSFYRVVAVDQHGVASGPSDLLELPHPFVYSQPVERAVLGQPYRYQVKTLRCLGDLQFRYAEPNRAFWEREGYEFALLEGPTWLQLDKDTGVLSGTPAEQDAGVHRVTVVCHRRYPAELKREDYRNSYFLKDAPRFQAQHRQSFRLTVRQPAEALRTAGRSATKQNIPSRTQKVLP